ncbi:hypothetical protein [Fictibacillus norfolkensis]|uniref:Short-chain dehydrogenase n=1 Tax=Fictibacillus norfolkensis TaxID=2762233 RepID=A0ABR8SIG1_9BACL|nr:hypothetical protein [Fictibacillus norfolkensis]MBD7963263.1 hypothetical protein [Fictibacillus norfolkensis]
MIIMGLTVLIVGLGFWWTWKLGKKQQTSYTEDEVNPAVTRHTALLNPILLTYIGMAIAFVIIIYVVYFAMR